MKIIRRGKKEVMQFQTPSGVIGTVATSIPAEAFRGWADSLEARLEQLEREEAASRAGLDSSPKPIP